MPHSRHHDAQPQLVSVEDGKAILRIIRRVIDHAGAKETPRRNKIYNATDTLLRACHTQTTRLDLAAMADADIQMVLEDLGTLRRNLNTKSGFLDYGSKLYFALKPAYKRQVAA
ncbi:hypothetical protein BJI49_13805 [Acetobacter pasteurianus]|uniref:hypothetical protein n=1 Tax=Acetobacter pasteurianus TaxID=438 RepID=UPI00031F27E5|nr:hypothetical protein [Acetobacter pasteurianus]RCL04289.1 hypothetical protein BJI49_13805 [Acetobacter pasteurianus]GCD50870.1 hypothetical protein NBRC106471_2426 [Acetobacter pasteurianus subsp. pasteurianus LMG 1262 = NBRC 106471]